MKEISTLTQNEKSIKYEIRNGGYQITWKSMKFNVSAEEIGDVMENLFRVDKWIPLGASQDKPIKGGFGEYIRDNYIKYTPRHASAIAAVMVEEGLLDSKGLKPVMLKKV